jgi:hypothetical protein
MGPSKIIALNSGAKSILKIGFIVRAGFVFFICVAAGMAGIHNLKDSFVFALLCFAVCFILFLIFYKLLSTAFITEYLVVTEDSITVVCQKIGNKDEYTVMLNDIVNFGFAGLDYTRHPFANTIVDFTGLATQERELQYVIDEGKIQMTTSNDVFRFGKNMPSWEVEEVLEKVEAFTGTKFKRPLQAPTQNLEIVTEITEENEREAMAANEPEQSSEELPSAENVATTDYTYSVEQGVLVIAQKEAHPSSEDLAYLNGETAATGKYQIGDKQFVMVSNGLVYAVRGF